MMARKIVISVIGLSFVIMLLQSKSEMKWEFSYALHSQESREFDHSHRLYEDLLKKHVKDARVDYKGFIDSSEQLDRYLDQLGSVRKQDYSNWTEEQQLAFWINAYNAFTIKAIIDYYPIKRSYSLVSFFVPKNSILQISGVWDRLRFRAAGRMVTLGEIEHVLNFICKILITPSSPYSRYRGDSTPI